MEAEFARLLKEAEKLFDPPSKAAAKQSAMTSSESRSTPDANEESGTAQVSPISSQEPPRTQTKSNQFKKVSNSVRLSKMARAPNGKMRYKCQLCMLCNVSASYWFPGDRSAGRYCASHKKPGMTRGGRIETKKGKEK